MSENTKFIFITGGVVSSLGKGLASASLASILQGRGFKVRMRKLDPYLNVDPGTMSPYQHGEVFVTDDGAETDLDLGHYERFSGVPCHKTDSITTGKIYQRVIDKERHGDYLGATIQVIPHVTNEIKSFILSDITDEDFVLCEIGGTVGDIEGQPYLEAIRQVAYELGRERAMFIHVTLLPYIPTAGELKTKPTQHSVKKLQEYGIQPDMLLCRSQMAIPQNEKRKIALFCNIREENVITALDVSSIYQVPVAYSNEGMDKAVCKHFGIECSKEPDLSKWEKILDNLRHPEGEVRIAVVGKYVKLLEAYKSLNEALTHGGIANKYKVKVKWIDSERLEHEKPEDLLSDVSAILVPGGFGSRGTEGMILAAGYARAHKVPYLGICLGMQMAMVEFARNVLGYQDANSSEFDPDTPHPVVDLMPEQNGIEDIGGTLRLGSYPCVLDKKSKAYRLYRSETINERHRHRFEVNNRYREEFASHGMVLSGLSPDGRIVEMIELSDHPFFIGTQAHPEFKSRPNHAHPLFAGFVESAEEQGVIRRAKKLLMKRNHLTEPEAHRYLQKTSMDTGRTITESAHMVTMLIPEN